MQDWLYNLEPFGQYNSTNCKLFGLIYQIMRMNRSIIVYVSFKQGKANEKGLLLEREFSSLCIKKI
jgi:hypothetical protein